MDDIDFFAGHFADDDFDAGAFDTDAGADRIDLRVRGGHGDFRAITRFTGDRLDLHEAFGYFGNLPLEQPEHELRAGAGYEQRRTRLVNVDFREEGDNHVADFVFFAGNLVSVAHGAFGLVEYDVDFVAVNASDFAGDQRVELVFVGFADVLLLRLA